MARLCIILGVCIAGVTGEDNVTLPVATTLPHASLPRIQEEAQRSESIVEPSQRSDSIVEPPLVPPPPPEPKRTHAPEPTRTPPPRPAEPVEGAGRAPAARRCRRRSGCSCEPSARPKNGATPPRYVQPMRAWTWRIADHRPPCCSLRAATASRAWPALLMIGVLASSPRQVAAGGSRRPSPVRARRALDASDEPPHGWARGAGGALLFIQASALASTKRSRALVGAVTAAALAAHYADATASVSIPITWQRGAAGSCVLS